MTRHFFPDIVNNCLTHWVGATNMFVLGASLALNVDRVCKVAASISRPVKAVLAAGAFLVYSMGIKLVGCDQFRRHVLEPLTRLPGLPRWADIHFFAYYDAALTDWMAALCGAIAICFALTDRRTKMVLNHPPILWLGRASYSLYLVHASVLFALAFILLDTRYAFLVAPLYIGITILLTAFFYYFVEIPSTNLGRNLARKMQKKATSEPVAEPPSTVVA